MRHILLKIALLPIVLADVPGAPACAANDETNCFRMHTENTNANSSIAGALMRKLASFTDNSFQCNIYLAPSSIPNAGFGLYTIKDVKEGEKLFPFTDAPSIPVCDEFSNGLEAEHWNHVDYLWSGSGLAEHECDSSSESVMTFGSLCNYHTYLTNVLPKNAKYDDTIAGGRFENPGAGAFSYHTGHDFHATGDISAGQEIFCDYGENWLDRRKGTFADIVPREADFETAAKVFLETLRNVRENELEITDGVLTLLKNVSSMLNNRVGGVFPDTKEVFEDILSRSSGDSESIGTIAVLLAEKMTIQKHDISWILEKGICMEKIRPGISNIPHAGRGAFAQELIPKGTIVSPAPLLNIVDKDLLEIEYEDSEFIGKQLLLNYCFGHRESKLLLCPQSNMILMNHKTCGYNKGTDIQDNCHEEGPNAKIQWANEWDPDTAEWLKLSFDEIKEMTESGRRGLSFEVVATRDILPGEEVTIDYGENWQMAWDEHTANWKKPVDDGSYIPVRTFTDEQKKFRTLEERTENPYPENILTVCYYPEGFDDYPEGGYVQDEWDGEDIISTQHLDVAYSLFPCDIIERDGEKESYTVHVYPEVDSNDDVFVRLVNYPKASVTFRMMPYKSDAHLASAFRHHIEIPDSMFPDQWKNISDTELMEEE